MTDYSTPLQAERVDKSDSIKIRSDRVNVLLLPFLKTPCSVCVYIEPHQLTEITLLTTFRPQHYIVGDESDD